MGGENTAASAPVERIELLCIGGPKDGEFQKINAYDEYRRTVIPIESIYFHGSVVPMSSSPDIELLIHESLTTREALERLIYQYAYENRITNDAD